MLVNNDPRILKALVARIERPGMIPNDTLIAGGFVLQGKSNKFITNLQQRISRRLKKVK